MTDTAVGLGDAGETAEAQYKETVERKRGIQHRQAPRDLQKRSQKNRCPAEKHMWQKVQKIKEYHVTAERQYALQRGFDRVVDSP